jgi:hypothetical protein
MWYIIALGIIAICFANMADHLWPPFQRGAKPTAVPKKRQPSKAAASEQEETAKAA